MEPQVTTPVETAATKTPYKKPRPKTTKQLLDEIARLKEMNINLQAKAQTREVDSSEIKVIQPPTQTIPGFNEPLPDHRSTIQAVDSPLGKAQLENLRFAEDPVTIILTPAREKNAAKYRDCWVNGKGIEVLIGNLWQEWKAIPTGAQVVTKRKYVEVLLRAKYDDIQTEVIRHEHHEDNNVKHNLTLTNHLTHVHDPAGVARGTKGGEWFYRLVAAEN